MGLISPPFRPHGLYLCVPRSSGRQSVSSHIERNPRLNDCIMAVRMVRIVVLGLVGRPVSLRRGVRRVLVEALLRSMSWRTVHVET